MTQQVARLQSQVTPSSTNSVDQDRRRLLLLLSAVAGGSALGVSLQPASAAPEMLSNPRRALTGRDASGKSVFHAFEITPRVVTFDALPGLVFWEVYATEDTPRLTGREPDPMQTRTGRLPGPGGSLFRLVQFPPKPPEGAESTPEAYEQFGKELAEKAPGWADHCEPDTPGMHTSDTIDDIVVIRGEIILELDDGQSVHLRQGDCVVQNGTRHRWRNPLSEPCLIAALSIGGRRV